MYRFSLQNRGHVPVIYRKGITMRALPLTATARLAGSRILSVLRPRNALFNTDECLDNDETAGEGATTQTDAAASV